MRSERGPADGTTRGGDTGNAAGVGLCWGAAGGLAGTAASHSAGGHCAIPLQDFLWQGPRPKKVQGPAFPWQGAVGMSMPRQRRVRRVWHLGGALLKSTLARRSAGASLTNARHNWYSHSWADPCARLPGNALSCKHLPWQRPAAISWQERLKHLGVKAIPRERRIPKRNRIPLVCATLEGEPLLIVHEGLAVCIPLWRVALFFE